MKWMAGLGEGALTSWLLVVGENGPKWEEQASAAAATVQTAASRLHA